MKNPRVNDFDPKAAPPLRSPMDDLPIIEAPKKEVTEPTTVSPIYAKAIITTEETTEETVVATNERFTERTKIRHTFDILADQLLALREIAVEREKVFGKRALLGELVQEALDLFIAKERNKE
jgi:hypothetical protein